MEGWEILNAICLKTFCTVHWISWHVQIVAPKPEKNPHPQPQQCKQPQARTLPLITPALCIVREAIKKKQSKNGYCPNWLRPTPPPHLALIQVHIHMDDTLQTRRKHLLVRGTGMFVFFYDIKGCVMIKPIGARLLCHLQSQFELHYLSWKKQDGYPWERSVDALGAEGYKILT